MVRHSRLLATEEKKNIRRAFIFLFLTGFLILGIIFLGLPTLAKFAAFLTDIRKTNQPIEKNDTTPPAPPRFNQLPEATNKSEIKIAGATEPGAAVTLTFNAKETEIIANADGEFVYLATLRKGPNTFFATAKDGAGNVSQKSSDVSVIFDDKAPELEISTPADGAEFFGSKQRQITISGKTDPETGLTINDRVVKVEDNGNFVFATSLLEGENTFNFKVVDKAGNSSEKSLTVKFSP